MRTRPETESRRTRFADRATWSSPHQIKLTFGRRFRRLHQYPACGGWGSRGRDHSSIRLFRPYGCAVRPPGSTRTDQVLEDWRMRSVPIIRLARVAAPSMTTPAVAYFQSATSSFRASATIVVLRSRALLRLTRSWNQSVSADCGWWRSHSQASCNIVVRSLGLPALDTPCSWATDPLCHGVGASPA